MIYDPVFQAIVAGTLIAFGIGLEHMRIRLTIRRKKQLRRESLGIGYRRDPEPVWARWSPEIGRGLKR